MSIDFLLVDPIYLPGISRYNGTTTGPLMAVNADASHSLTEVFWVPMLQWVGGPMTPLSCWSLPHHAGYHWSTNVTEINDVALGHIFWAWHFLKIWLKLAHDIWACYDLLWFVLILMHFGGAEGTRILSGSKSSLVPRKWLWNSLNLISLWQRSIRIIHIYVPTDLQMFHRVSI